MNCAALLDLLMSRLGNRTEPALRATCLNEMILAQADKLENSPVLPWFLITEDATVATVANERRVAVPDDFIREVDEEKPLMYVPSDTSQPKVILTKRGYDENLSWFASARSATDITTTTETPGSPQRYSMRGDYFMMFPLPNAAYTILLPGYYARQAAPQDSPSFENKWMKWCPTLLLCHAGVAMAGEHLQDTELMMKFQAEIPIQEKKLIDLETAREEANRDRQMGMP